MPIMMPRLPINISPGLEQRPAYTVHPRLGSVIGVVDVQHDLLSGPTVGGCEGLVPFAEDESLRDW